MIPFTSTNSRSKFQCKVFRRVREQVGRVWPEMKAKQKSLWGISAQNQPLRPSSHRHHHAPASCGASPHPTHSPPQKRSPRDQLPVGAVALLSFSLVSSRNIKCCTLDLLSTSSTRGERGRERKVSSFERSPPPPVAPRPPPEPLCGFVCDWRKVISELPISLKPRSARATTLAGLLSVHVDTWKKEKKIHCSLTCTRTSKTSTCGLQGWWMGCLKSFFSLRSSQNGERRFVRWQRSQNVKQVSVYITLRNLLTHCDKMILDIIHF